MSKRTDVLSYFKDKHQNILCLQETRWIERDRRSIKILRGNEIFLSNFKSNAVGVAVLLKKNFEYKTVSFEHDTEGNYLHIKLKVGEELFNIITIYDPNKDEPLFFDHMRAVMQESCAYTIICGDLI